MTTARAATWASTMHGAPAIGGVHVAHEDSSAEVGRVDPFMRERREADERARLTAGATLSHGAGDRAVEEEPDRYRTCFERDRDRILHAPAFRRLAGKTQVFIFPEDHQRSRLTHALEVAQVAVSIARTLGLNTALTEAIALAHDCGHTPGGHAGEDALEPFVDGGFDHAVWGADVTLVGLNLCRETLDGVRNHSWSRPAPSTPEGEVVSWADRIAYVCHDFEDAVHAGIVAPSALPAQVVDRCGRTRRQQLAAFIAGVCDAAARTGRIAMMADAAEALAAFRRFNYDEIYLRPASVKQGAVVVTVLRHLVEHFEARPDEMPEHYRNRDDHLLGAVDYVSGMTDRFAFLRAEQVGALPDGVTLDDVVAL